MSFRLVPRPRGGYPQRKRLHTQRATHSAQSG